MKLPTIAERKEQAVKLFVDGYTYREIADIMGISFKQVGNYINDVMQPSKDISEDKKAELREAAQARYGESIRSALTEIRAGNYKAIDQLMKVEGRLASMMGLDEPAKQEVTARGSVVVFGEEYEGI